jgi:hypothetical protein
VILHRRTAFLLGLVLLAGDQPVGHSIEEIGITLGSIAGAGWSLEGLEARLAWRDEVRAALRLTAAKVALPEPLGDFTGLRGECLQGSITPQAMTCHDGIFRLDSAHLGAQQLHLDFDYRLASGRLVLAVDRLRVDGGTVAATLEMKPSGWKLTLRGNALQLAALSARLVAAGVLTAPLSGPGTLGFDATIRGAGAHVRTARLSARLQTEEISDAAGHLAGEDLGLSLDARVVSAADRWRVTGSVAANRGRLYVDPVFVDLGPRPVHATAAFDWQPSTGHLEVRDFEFDQPDTLRLHAAGLVRVNRPVSLGWVSIELGDSHFPGLYDTYLQPWLNDTPLADLQTAGVVAAKLQWRQGRPTAIRLDLDDVSFNDREGRYGLGGLRGQVNWTAMATAAGETQESDLRWQNGHLYRVPLGAGSLALESAGSSVRLREPAHIGVVDGELQIDTLELGYSVDAGWRWHGDGFLTPVSLPRLCRSLEWPEFAGKLSGVIPDLRYADGTLEVGGVLLVRVFDGYITLDNLKLEQPFSVVPRLRVDARVKNIDLESLTRAFSFGEIDGRLDGRVDGLDMEAWRPVAFDARFATPAGDTSRHRISQKAVDNISSIGGGGVSGALSRGILRFFEDFPYDKLGISCRLENGTCEMGGVAPAANGYYIVKGRLLPPRLDVIGYADRVNWRALVSQLVAVIGRHGGARVQ